MTDGMTYYRRRPNFAAVPYELADDENISPQAKTVYMALDRHADYRTGATFVGKDLIARKCMLKKASSVDRYLKELRESGWISWRRRWRKDTGKISDGRKIYEYSYKPGDKFEPTTNLYIVNDRVGNVELSGEGIPPAGDTGASLTADTGVSAAGDEPMSATRGTNENQGNENQGKGVGVGGNHKAEEVNENPPPLSDDQIGEAFAAFAADTPSAARCRKHAGLPSGEVPACGACRDARVAAEGREADRRFEVEARERLRASQCGFCGGSGRARARNGKGQWVEVRCDHVSAPVDAPRESGHREVSDPARRRAMIAESLNQRKSG